MIEICTILEIEKQIDGLKVVLLDLDDTLYSEKEYLHSGYREIAKVLPQIEDAFEKLCKLFEEGKPAVDELLKSEGIYSESLKQKCLYAYRYHKPDIHLYSGVREMLLRLKESVFLGLITDGRPEGQRAKIASLELEPIFDRMIITDELGSIAYRKPSLRAFEMMAKYFGTSYSQMCYVGDNIRKDFIAPEHLGIRSIWFKNESGLYF